MVSDYELPTHHKYNDTHLSSHTYYGHCTSSSLGTHLQPLLGDAADGGLILQIVDDASTEDLLRLLAPHARYNLSWLQPGLRITS